MKKAAKKTILNNVSGKNGWRTTVLGITIILAVVASVFFVPGITWWPEGVIGICLGVVLWFAPDRIIEIFSNFMGNTKTTIRSRTGRINSTDDLNDDVDVDVNDNNQPQDI